jgi:hypothetical protein
MPSKNYHQHCSSVCSIAVQAFAGRVTFVELFNQTLLCNARSANDSRTPAAFSHSCGADTGAEKGFHAHAWRLVLHYYDYAISNIHDL